MKKKSPKVYKVKTGNTKSSSVHNVLSAVVMIAAAGLVGFVGYSIAKPFIQDDAATSDSSLQMNAAVTTQATEAATTSETTTATTAVPAAASTVELKPHRKQLQLQWFGLQLQAFLLIYRWQERHLRTNPPRRQPQPFPAVMKQLELLQTKHRPRPQKQ